jgi:hypothetical protein
MQLADAHTPTVAGNKPVNDFEEDEAGFGRKERRFGTHVCWFGKQDKRKNGKCTALLRDFDQGKFGILNRMD